MTRTDDVAAKLARLYQDLDASYEDDLRAATSLDEKQKLREALDRANEAALAALAIAFTAAQAGMPAAVAALDDAVAKLEAARAEAESFEQVLTAIGTAVEAATSLVGLASPIG